MHVNATLKKILLPIATGLAMALLCFVAVRPYAGDLTWALRGARLLLEGQNPYTDPTIGPGLPYPFDAPLRYPVPALLLVAPLAWLPYPVAAALFAGVSLALLCFVWRAHPALIGMLLSAPLSIAVAYAQWSPLMVAAAGLPWLGFLLLAKPSIGLALWAWKPDRRALVGAGLLWVVSLLIMPGWVSAWLGNLTSARYVSPILAFPVLALALLKWRDGRARLIFLLSLVPQFAGSSYDHLPLFLAMRTPRQGLALALSSWVGVLIVALTRWEGALVLSTYGTALAVLFEEEIRRLWARRILAPVP